MPEAGGHRERNAEIAHLSARGYQIALIAEVYGLTDRQVRRILKDQPPQNAAFFAATEHERVKDLLERHDSVIEDAALEAMWDPTPTQRLRALEVKLRALDQKKCFLDELGLLPHFNPPTADATYPLGVAAIGLLQRHGASKELQQELLELIVHWFEGTLTRHQRAAG